MKKEDIIYERDITHSYIKISAEEDNLDVTIMLHQKIKGLLTIERCYVNGRGEYWYDISGKQALDNFIKLHTFTYAMFEKLMLRICEQLEILEWNLLNENGLILNPEYIFINSKGETFSFLFYPHEKQNVMQELQKLLEYLLTKLDHSKQELVRGAYEIYELTLCDSYHIEDIKTIILRRRMSETILEEVIVEEEEDEQLLQEECISKDHAIFLEEEEDHVQNKIIEQLKEFYKKIKTSLYQKSKENLPSIIYPEEEPEERKENLHPTVCINVISENARGTLLYEGMGDYPDFEIGKGECIIGKSKEVSLQIPKETISHFHAKIEYKDGYYIEDINSTNGTFVNEELLNYREKRKLNAGDMIRFADVKYRFL